MVLKNKIQKFIIYSSNKLKINSRDIKKNDVFLALEGANYHGNKYIKDALNAGAKFCITDKKVKRFNNGFAGAIFVLCISVWSKPRQQLF